MDEKPERRWLRFSLRTLLVLIALVALVGFSAKTYFGRRTIRISDPSKPKVMLLEARALRFPDTSGLTIWVHGDIEGTAEITASNWEPILIDGRIKYVIYHDWFEPTCELTYTPHNVKGGDLVIRYKFH